VVKRKRSADNSYLVSYCVVMVSVLNGPVFLELCHMISMISAKRSQTTFSYMYVVRVECEVYLMEATQNLG